jgi:hypothetical protein
MSASLDQVKVLVVSRSFLRRAFRPGASALPRVPLVLYAVLIGIEYVVLAAYLGYFLDS